MATAPLDPSQARPISAPESNGEANHGRSTSHLKQIPQPRAVRARIRARCGELAAELDKSRPLTRDEIEGVSRVVQAELGLPEGYLGWTMVALASAFWQDQLAGVPFQRRLLLLPHCLRDESVCAAEFGPVELECHNCSACQIGQWRQHAERLGYRVLVAEGSPVVLRIIVSGEVDAIVGVACLNVLEKALDKILLAGIPCMAVPLLSCDCRATSVDEDWVDQMIHVRQQPAAVQARSYVHLMRMAAALFEPAELERLVPRGRGGPALADMNGQGIAGLDPTAGTEAIAYDFLAKGGKHSRPFITLAVYDALTGGRGTLADGAEHLAGLPDAIKRIALSIETFHKASLVHDDVEDDDAYRYAQPALHRKYGVPTAVNVGDFLIGLGYRLISRQTAALGAEVTADILDRLADAHLRLTEGQGAELLWRDALDKRLAPIDALRIYALKTAPAFEAAIYAGMRLAGPADLYRAVLPRFARNLGVAFQILNDLDDWRQDDHNKLAAGTDAVGGRPTVLWALALEGLPEPQRVELESLAAGPVADRDAIARLRRLFQRAGAFDKASRLVEKYRQRAAAVADEVQPGELRRLFHYLIDVVLRTAS